MIGTYYKTIMRDWETGDTVFLLSPVDGYEEKYVKDGLIKCSGKIGVCVRGLPVEVEGVYNTQTEIFLVSADKLPVNTRRNTMLILDYITDDLTDCQKEKIADMADNDLFSFVMLPDAADQIMDLFKNKERAAKMTKLIIRKVRHLKEQEAFTKEMLSYGMPLDTIETLIRREITMESIDRDPYIILLKFGAPIGAIEMYAVRRMHLSEYHLIRISGFAYDAMLYLSKNGNTCATPQQMVKTMNMRINKYGVVYTKIDLSVVNLCVIYLKGELVYRELDGKAYVYLSHIWEEECIAIQHIMRLQKKSKSYTYDVAGISDVEKSIGITYNEGQRSAFGMLKTSGIKILTGPPGSGKTAVLRGLMSYFTMNRNGVVKLSATTGMAAKVMADACNDEAETANLMLNVRPFDNSVEGRNLNNPVEADLIIVDETSMLGLQLFSILVGAIRNDSILLLVGDEDQLQSVEYGSVLHDLIASGIIEVCRLTEILRQSGTICDNAKLVNSGSRDLVTDASFSIKRYVSSFDIVQDLTDRFQKGTSQIISPIKNGDVGTRELNVLFQDPAASIAATYGKKTFRIGDKVVMVRTDYEIGYINGDMGYVVGKNDDSSIIVKFASQKIVIPRKNLRDMELGDAVTIHKSQGSEFDDIHIILPSDARHMITKRILYTAITRAKKKVTIYAMDDMLETAIKNISERNRMTLLTERVVEAYNNEHIK